MYPSYYIDLTPLMKRRSYSWQSFICFFLVILFGVFLFYGTVLPTLAGFGSETLTERKIAEGRELRQKGKFAQARDSFNEAFKLTKDGQDPKHRLLCLINLGGLSWNLGLVRESVNYYEEGLSLARELGLVDEQKECATAIQIYKLYAQAKDLREQNHREESIRNFRKAINLAKKIKSPEHELKCLRQLSLNYSEGEEEFFRLNKQGLDLAKKINHRLEEGRCLNNIGLFYWKSNKFSKALAILSDALLIIREVDRGGDDESACLNNLGVVYRDLGDYDKALHFLRDALEIDISLNNDSAVSMEFKNIGAIYRAKSEIIKAEEYLEQALEYYKKALTIATKIGDRRLQAEGLSNIGNIYLNLGDKHESVKNHKVALNIAKKEISEHTLSNVLTNLGNAYLELRNLEKAKYYYDQALEIALSAGRNEILWEIYFGLGKCMEYQEKSKLALTYYRMSMEIIDSIRSNLALDFHKAAFFRDKLKVYESCLNLLFSLMTEPATREHNEVFFNVVERAKARTFLEGLEQRLETSQPVDDVLQQKMAEIAKKISRSISELMNSRIPSESAREIWERLEEEEDQYLVYLNQIELEKREKSSLPSFEVLSLESIQNILNPQTAILEFFLGETQSYAFLITKKDFALSKLPGRSVIEDSLKGYLKMISTPTQKGFKGVAAAKRIYEELVLPFERYFHASAQHLIFIPDGVLYYLPFETLIPTQKAKQDGSRYLVESYKISYAPSVSSLVYLTQKGQQKQKAKLLFGMGSPIYSSRASKDGAKNKPGKYEEPLREFYLNKGFDFSSLPYSKKEIKQIARFFPKKGVDIFMGKRAKEEVVKKAQLSDYQILHFACHAFLDEKTPHRSALVLSLDNDAEEDGFLQVREIQSLKLDANLAILSACQTGRGKIENGEGIFGLPRVFFYAGALSTISTLWKVNDKVSSDFMRNFYHYLAEGNDKAQSLRLAKIKMLRSKFSHPFYWAGFILNGDYQSRLSFR